MCSHRPQATRLIAVWAAAFVVGCARRSSESDGSIVSRAPASAIILTILFGIALLGVSAMLLRKRRRVVAALVGFVGLVFVALIAPMLGINRSAVRADGFDSNHGFWWRPVHHRVRYDRIADVSIETDTQQVTHASNSRDVTETQHSYYMNVRFTDGSADRLPINDTLRPLMPEIIAGLRAHGISLLVPDGLAGH